MMAKDKLRLILGRVDPKDRILQGVGGALSLDHMLKDFRTVDNIYDISKKRYLTRAEARSFAELVMRIETDLNRIIFMEFCALSSDIDLFASLAHDVVNHMRHFAERQSRVQHSHRIPIIDIPRLKAYRSIADSIKIRLHSLHMEVDNGSLEGQRALTSGYFTSMLHDLGSMRMFGERHLTDAVGMINSKNSEDESMIRSERRRLKKHADQLGRMLSAPRKDHMNKDIETLNTLFNGLFKDEESILTIVMDRMSYSRHSVKELSKIQNYLDSMVKEVERRSKTRIPSRRSAQKKMRKLSHELKSRFSENMRKVGSTVKTTVSTMEILDALSSNIPAQHIYTVPKDQQRVEFKDDDEERALKKSLTALKRYAEKKGTNQRIVYSEKDTGEGISRTFRGTILVLDNSSFISFYNIAKQKHIRFALVFKNAIVLGHGTNHEDMKLEWMNMSGKEEVRGDYAERLSDFLETFIHGKAINDKEWVDEITGMLVSSHLEAEGYLPNSNLITAKD